LKHNLFYNCLNISSVQSTVKISKLEIIQINKGCLYIIMQSVKTVFKDLTMLATSTTLQAVPYARGGTHNHPIPTPWTQRTRCLRTAWMKHRTTVGTRTRTVMDPGVSPWIPMYAGLTAAFHCVEVMYPFQLFKETKNIKIQHMRYQKLCICKILKARLLHTCLGLHYMDI